MAPPATDDGDDVVTRLLAALEPAVNAGSSISEDDPSSPPSAPLKRWNDDVEAGGFGAAPGNDERSSCDPSAVLVGAAEALHSNLVSCVASDPSLFAGTDSQQVGGGDGIGSESEPAAAAAGSFSPGDSSSDVDADLAAYRAARAVRTAEPIGTHGTNGDDDSSRLRLASELLRATKNLIRHVNQTRHAAAGLRRFVRSDGENGNDDDPLRRIRSPNTLRLYLTLVDCCSSHYRPSAGAADSGAGAGVSSARDDVARNASLSLFHATYGTRTENSAAYRARTVLIDELDGIPKLMELLVARDHPTSLLLSLVRHVHCLLGSDPKLVTRMDGALAKLAMASKDDDDGETREAKYSKDLVSVLVATLAWAVRSDPPFPGTDGTDRRADLATEILRVLFALRATGAVPTSTDASNINEREGIVDSGIGNGNENEAMTQLGILLTDLLHVPNADLRAYQTKLAAVNLLMDCPSGFARYLRINGAVPPLLTVLRLQLDEVIVVRTGSGAADAAAVVPILAVLERLSAEDGEVLQMVKDYIFPPDDEEDFGRRAKVETDKLGGTGGEGGGGGIRAKNMQPLDAPPGTVRWKLIRLMTWIESNVKRCAPELLWTVCGGNATEFVLRTGYGNAVHMLGIKGLVSIPKESSIKF